MGRNETVIVKIKRRWYLYSLNRKKLLGKFLTKKDALKRERQINFFKHVRG